MTELTYFVATSLDGFIAAPGGDASAFPTDGDHIAHLLEQYPETMPAHVRSALGIDDPGHTFGTVVMGWNTFAVGLEHGVTSPYPHLRQLVVSRQERSGQVGHGVEVITDDVRAVVDGLRSTTTERDIWLCGGGELAGHLLESIDRVVLKVNPIVLGAGIHLFGGTQHSLTAFAPVAPPKVFESGVTMLDYRRRP